ncbi:MAG: hypothetical protein NE334_20635 [Lentisphaeraceae bacterium]|nr:hypothetical protein [Lentisphaeraceae bacterium]
MNFIANIILISTIAFTAIIPDGLVLCEKNGRISLEFENGQICSCEESVADLIEKICCEDTECHENPTVTDDCHEKNIIDKNDCQDTELNFPKIVKSFEKNLKASTKPLIQNTFTTPTSKVKALERPVEVGKKYSTELLTTNTPLLHFKTLCLLI